MAVINIELLENKIRPSFMVDTDAGQKLAIIDTGTILPIWNESLLRYIHHYYLYI